MSRALSRKILSLLVAVLLCAVTLEPVPAWAAESSGGPVASCADYAGLTNKVASCIRATLDNITDKFFEGFYPLVQKMIAGFLTLGVVIYGVMAAAGMIEKIGRDTIMLLIKYSMISYFVLNTDMLYHMAIDAMDGLGEAVVEFTPDKGTATEKIGNDHITCMENMKEASANAEVGYSPAWLAMDCMIDSVIGIKVPAKVGAPAAGGAVKYFNDNLSDADRGMSRGMLYLFFSSMQTSVIGILLAVIGFIFVYSLIFLIIKALFTYTAGYIGISFLLIFAPLFIPMVLFRRTKEYFDKWLKLIISFALQPIVILVFMMFSIAAVDLAMFSGDYSLMYRVAGEASRQQGFSLNKYLEETGAISIKPKTIALIPTTRETPGGELKDENTVAPIFNSQCVQSFMKLDPKLKEICDQNYAVQFMHNAIDWEKLAKARNPAVTMSGDATRIEQQMTREVMSAAIFCALVVFVMNAMLSIVPTMANDLIGDIYQSPNLYAQFGQLPGQQQAQQMAGQFGAQISDVISNRNRR